MNRINSYSILTNSCGGVLICLCGLFFNQTAIANPESPQGIQLAYFVGYHSGGMYQAAAPAPLTYTPRHHYKKRYKSRLISGRVCRKSCVLDRWTGKALSCTITC